MICSSNDDAETPLGSYQDNYLPQSMDNAEERLARALHAEHDAAVEPSYSATIG